MPLDRYVARRASGNGQGKLKTVRFELGRATRGLHVNADADGGSIRVQVRDATSGEVFPGLSFADCAPIDVDGIRQPVRWKRSRLSDLAGKTVQLEFAMNKADLFAFEFVR